MSVYVIVCDEQMYSAGRDGKPYWDYIGTIDSEITLGVNECEPLYDEFPNEASARRVVRQLEEKLGGPTGNHNGPFEIWRLEPIKAYQFDECVDD